MRQEQQVRETGLYSLLARVGAGLSVQGQASFGGEGAEYV